MSHIQIQEPLLKSEAPPTYAVFTFWKAMRILYAMSTYAIMFILVRVWGEMMPTHSFFYSMSWAIGFIPCFFILFLGSRYWHKTPVSALDSPWPMIKQSIFIGFTYAVNYWGVSTSAPHVGGPAQVVFSQLPLPLAAVFTAFAFRRRYNVVALIGVVLTLVGTIVQATAPGVSGTTSIGWALVFMCGNLPNSVWAVTLEGFHKAQGPDGRTNTMELRMMWTNFFLVIWLVIFIPFFGLLNQPPQSDFTENFWQATDCVFTGSGGLPEDDCGRAGWVLFLTIIVASLQAHSQIILARDDSGLFASLALTIAPFLADFIFPYGVIMGPYTESVSKWDGLAAALCFVGVVAFTYGERTRTDADRQEQVNASKLIAWFMSIELPEALAKYEWIRYLLGPNEAYNESQRGSAEIHA